MPAALRETVAAAQATSAALRCFAMRTHVVAPLVAAAAALLPCSSEAQSGPFYDPAPGLAALRPAGREALAAAGITALDRLPGYDLALTLQPAQRTLTLREELFFTNTSGVPLREVVLRVYGNVVHAAAHGDAGAPVPPVRFVRGECGMVACTVRQESPSVIVARFTTPLAVGARVRVVLDLAATLPEIAAGRTNLMAQGMESMSAMAAGESGGDYGLLAIGDGIVSMANFYAVLARREGVAWERTEPSGIGDLGSDDLANVHAVVDLPAGYTVATTGVTVRRVEGVSAGVGRQRVEVVAAAVRDFAVMAGEGLDVATRRVGDVEVRSIYLHAHADAGARVLDVAAHALEDFERRFGPYPYADLDVVEAPLVGGAGGVEFPGLVTVASMFYRPVNTTAGSSDGNLGGLLGALGGGGAVQSVLGQMVPSMLEFVTAHEVAHQWWHGLVGSDSRAHPFVDESLAQWSAALYLADRYGAARAEHDANLQVKMNYQFMRMLGEADGAVDRPASAFHSPMAYAGIVYGKGPYLYDALRRTAGDEVFWRAMRRYVTAWRFRIAPPTAFVDALATEDRAHAPRYRALAQRWLHEAHGDEDLGEADLSAMLGGMLGGDGAQVPAELRDALRMLGPMLRGNGHPARPGATPNAAPEVSPQQLQELLDGVMRQLGND